VDGVAGRIRVAFSTVQTLVGNAHQDFLLFAIIG
jgi:hypothetical protein